MLQDFSQMTTICISLSAQGLKGDPGSPGVAGPKGEKVHF